jgi:CheY-like chemotaxis protein
LTRQLLAFSRTQVLQPTILDLNLVVAGVEKMLQRLIGEDVEFSVSPGTNLAPVLADPGQIEQVIMNLAINARDAMPTGGKLSIETANVDLGDEYAAKHIQAVPGQYVMLAVSDTGCGMDAETRRRAFEPFFTTKEQGKGTGLGLSTCFGIVKQSGGYIWIYSEPGHGTTFKIYLPRTEAAAEAGAVRKASGAAELGGSETILVVEDDDRVRDAVRRILSARGYKVLLARDGDEALAISQVQEEPIGLVLSDVIVPGQSGPELVTRLARSSSKTKVLFMSGYSDHAVLRHGVLRAGMNFIQKPFAPEALGRKVREVLDA